MDAHAASHFHCVTCTCARSSKFYESTLPHSRCHCIGKVESLGLQQHSHTQLVFSSTPNSLSFVGTSHLVPGSLEDGKPGSTKKSFRVARARCIVSSGWDLWSGISLFSVRSERFSFYPPRLSYPFSASCISRYHYTYIYIYISYGRNAYCITCTNDPS